MARAALAVATAALAGCIDPGAFICAQDADCGSGGACEPAGFCSFADTDCDSGRRYGEHSGSLASTCVGDTSGGDGMVEIALGADHACARDAAGAIACWGSNVNGALGDGTTDDASAPIAVAGLPPVTRLAAGELHTCAIADGIVWCWGGGDHGQLGDGDRHDRGTPAPIAGLTDEPELSQVVNLALGEFQSCALTSGGAVYCWGENQYGQLGLGDTDERATPARVAVSGIVSLVADGDDTCAIATDHTVYCWGKNQYGQLGLGDTDDRLSPTRVPWLDDTVFDVGGDHLCAIDAAGATRCAGRNDYGQIGDGSIEARSRPVVVQGMPSAVELAAGDWFTCGRTFDDVRCWGRNDDGELGDGPGDNRNKPKKPVGLVARAGRIAAGERHVCALAIDGAVWCWGADDLGQRGDGDQPGNAPVSRVAFP